MKVRIVPRKIWMPDGNTLHTWYKVQVQRTIFRIGPLRMWTWRTVGYYSSLVDAGACIVEVKKCYEENNHAQ